MRYRPLVCLALIHMLVDGFAQVVAPLWPRLESELHVAPWVISAMIGAWQIATSISQPLFGYLGDRFDNRWVVALGPALAMVSVTMIGFASGPVSMAVLLVVGGLGIGAFHPEAAVGVVQASGTRITRGLAIFTFGGMVGLGVGPSLSGALAEHFGLRSLAWMTLPGLLLLATLVVVRGPVAHPHIGSSSRGTSLAAVLDGRGLSVLLLLTVATLRVIPALGIPIGMAFLLKQQGEAEFGIGLMQSLFLLSGGVGTLLCPLFARAGRELSALVGTTLLAAGFLALLARSAPWAWYIGLIGSGFLLQGTIPILIAYSQRLLPRGQRLAASLTLGASWGLGGLIVAGLQAIFASTGHLEGMLWVMVPFALASAAFAALLPRTASLPAPKPLLRFAAKETLSVRET